MRCVHGAVFRLGILVRSRHLQDELPIGGADSMRLHVHGSPDRPEPLRRVRQRLRRRNGMRQRSLSVVQTPANAQKEPARAVQPPTSPRPLFRRMGTPAGKGTITPMLPPLVKKTRRKA